LSIKHGINAPGGRGTPQRSGLRPLSGQSPLEGRGLLSNIYLQQFEQEKKAPFGAFFILILRYVSHG